MFREMNNNEMMALDGGLSIGGMGITFTASGKSSVYSFGEITATGDELTQTFCFMRSLFSEFTAVTLASFK